MKLRYTSAPRSCSHKEYSCFDFRAHSLFTFDVFWACVLVFLGTQVQPRIILDSDYLPGYISVSYDYEETS